jgi:hypothetical protein
LCGISQYSIEYVELERVTNTRTSFVVVPYDYLELNTKDQARALAYLIGLLPSSNRDTLYTLLKFLYRVSLNAQDRCTTDGKLLVSGNKMDAANLAIVFAPTILMDGKAPVMSSKGMSVAASADQMEQGKSVLKMMIEQYKELFMVGQVLSSTSNRIDRVMSFVSGD